MYPWALGLVTPLTITTYPVAPLPFVAPISAYHLLFVAHLSIYLKINKELSWKEEINKNVVPLSFVAPLLFVVLVSAIKRLVS